MVIASNVLLILTAAIAILHLFAVAFGIHTMISNLGTNKEQDRKILWLALRTITLTCLTTIVVWYLWNYASPIGMFEMLVLGYFLSLLFLNIRSAWNMYRNIRASLL